MSTEEATINTDGSSTFQEQTQPPDNTTTEGEIPFDGNNDDTIKNIVEKGIDPAYYVLFGFIVIAILYYFFVIRKKAEESDDDFFTSLDGEKVRMSVGRYCSGFFFVSSSHLGANFIEYFFKNLMIISS